jgi:uncharacterized protein YjbJ (UPF0337 family)
MSKTPASSKNWTEQKPLLKSKFPILTDDDLHFKEGKKDEMMTCIQKKIGKSKEELQSIIAAL